MKVKKYIRGWLVDLDIVWLKNYNNYGLYQIFKIEKGKRIPLYKECFTSEQIKEIIKTKLIVSEEACL